MVTAYRLYVYNDSYILCDQLGVVGKEPLADAGNQAYLHQAWVHRRGKGRGTVSLLDGWAPSGGDRVRLG